MSMTVGPVKSECSRRVRDVCEWCVQKFKQKQL